MNHSILLVDDHALFRQGLQMLLETQPDFQVVGHASSGSEALAVGAGLKPDVIILDMLMPGMNGLETLYQLRQSLPESRIIILSMSDEAIYVHSALHGGASAYILKDSSAEDMVAAVRSVLAGKIYLSPILAERAIHTYAQSPLQTASGGPTLTPREREILRLTVQRLSSLEIAGRLYISARTVESHRANLMHKLGLHSQIELVQYAQQNHLFEAEDNYLSNHLP